MQNGPRKLSVGKDAVVIGNVTGHVGDGSVIIGATDERGNTIINTPMAVGRGAFAGPGSIAIGAGAGAGASANLPFLVNQLYDAVGKTNDPALVAQFNELIAEVNGENGKTDKSKIKTILGHLRNAATLNGVLGLIDKIASLFN